MMDFNRKKAKYKT